MATNSRFAIRLGTCTIFASAGLILASGVTAALVHRAAAGMTCLGIGLLALLALASAFNLKAMSIAGGFIGPAAFIMIGRMVEPTWAHNGRFFGAIAVGLMLIQALTLVLTLGAFDRVRTAMGFFAISGVLLATAKLALLPETFGPTEVAGLASTTGCFGTSTLASTGPESEVRPGVALWANILFYPCLLVCVTASLFSRHTIANAADVAVVVEFVTGFNELGGPTRGSRRAAAAGVAALAMLMSFPECRIPLSHALAWIVRPANWPLVGMPIIWSLYCLRARVRWRQFLQGILLVALIVWMVRGFYIRIGIARPEQTWSDLRNSYKK